MTEAPRLRIALLTHSTNPRGGVVHTLELADELTILGHDVTVFAPDVTQEGFFRPTLCKTCAVPAEPAGADIAATVARRVEEYLRYFHGAGAAQFDVWHGQDGISGNALATLKDRGAIPAFVRTVHHVDQFFDPRLTAFQRRSIESADRLLCVSELWRTWLRREFDREAIVVGNGVDLRRFSPLPGPTDRVLRQRLGFRTEAEIFLAVGGVEERKNTLSILDAFRRVFSVQPAARLVIAGGASLLDHGAYQECFAQALAASGLPDSAVLRTGPLPQDLMPALFRAATALVFPSLKEGFGLVVLEAMASGTPVIVSRIAPFTEYLTDDDVLWCSPDKPASVADAMMMALRSATRERLRSAGLKRAAYFDWSRVAAAHLAQYALIRESCDA